MGHFRENILTSIDNMIRMLHNTRRFLARTGILLAIFVVVIVLGISVGRVFVRQASFGREIAALEAERERLSSDSRSFERQLVFVSSEAFLEQEARETFGQKRPGETVVYVDESPRALSQTTEETEGVFSPLKRWLDFFFPTRL